MNFNSSFTKTSLPRIDSSDIGPKLVQRIESTLLQELKELETIESLNEYRRTFSDVYGSVSDLRSYDEKVLSYFPDSSYLNIDTTEFVSKLEDEAIRQLNKNDEIRSANEMLNQQENELEKLKSEFNDPRENIEEFTNNPSKWMKYAPQEAINDAIETVRNLTAKQKNKFRSFSTDETVSQVKSNSFKGAPLKKRFLFECDFQTQIDKESSIDLLPSIGWKINRGWSLAGGLSYRVFLTVDQNSIYTDQDVKGYRFFTDYTIWKSLFLRGEYESLNVAREGDKGSESYWTDSAAIGAGNTFRFSDKIDGKLVIQYNLLHSERSPNRSPLTLRFGLSI